MEVPQGVSFEVSGTTLKVKGPKGELVYEYNPQLVRVQFKDGKIEVLSTNKKLTRKYHAAVNSVYAHIKAMFKGAAEGYEKKLSIVYAHFPITVEIKGADVMVKNFLGEKTPRKTKVLPGAKVEVHGQDITVSGADKYAVGQTANNIVSTSKVGHRDQRVFQDGIYFA